MPDPRKHAAEAMVSEGRWWVTGGYKTNGGGTVNGNWQKDSVNKIHNLVQKINQPHLVAPACLVTFLLHQKTLTKCGTMCLFF